MSKTNRKVSQNQWADVDGGYAFVIPYTTIRHANFERLSPHGIKLLMDLGRQYSGFNNGYLCPAWTLMKEKGWKSRDTLFWAIKECEHYRLITLTRQGGRNAANLYALTWWRIHEKREKPLDVAQTFKASHNWKSEREVFCRENVPRKRKARKKKIKVSNTPSEPQSPAARVSQCEGHTNSVSAS